LLNFSHTFFHILKSRKTKFVDSVKVYEMVLLQFMQACKFVKEQKSICGVSWQLHLSVSQTDQNLSSDDYTSRFLWCYPKGHPHLCNNTVSPLPRGNTADFVLIIVGLPWLLWYHHSSITIYSSL